MAGRRKKLAPKRSWIGRLLRGLTGNATTETVIMIPVFVVIWGGIYYTYLRHERVVSMAQFTRADVWAYAYDSCDNRTGDTSIGERDSDSSGFMSGAMSIVTSILGFNIQEIEGRRTRSAQRPAVLGEGAAHMGHNLVVLCNEPKRGDNDFFSSAMSLLGGL